MTNRIHRLAAAAVLASVSLATPPAFAEDPPTTTRSSWYGWQTLLVDGGAWATAVATQSPLVFTAGFTLGGPIVHWAHGNVLKGFASLGVRVVAPIVTAFAVSSLEGSEAQGGHERDSAIAAGLLGGSLFAAAFDAIVLARSTEIVPQRSSSAPRWRVEPRITASPRGASAGLGTTF